MNTVYIFVWIWAAMIALSFVEGYVEGRNPWHHRKLGWKIKLPKGYLYPAYHFYLFVIMLPLLITLPLVINGWDLELFGILMSAYFSGLIIEDFCYFIVNPAVKFSEFWTEFTDYYPWIKIKGKKIIPQGYVWGVLASLASWYFLWK
ncbi:MAG: hypothetical protein QGH89_06975 [Candidatus Marinimicrobia bacterium]|nr:hypothetical protein [Candidatus Neomarinimicrobiota bacterium]